MFDVNEATERLALLRDWFSGFTRSFSFTNEDDQRNISLKIKHTHEVCKNIRQIATGETTDGSKVLTAETIGLLHDIGRFPQYARFRTFDDRISVNHGELGADIISTEGLLRDFPGDEQEVITYAVRFHNAFSIPPTADSRKGFFLRLVRDADKLDIWRVFIEYYSGPRAERASAAAIGLPELDGYSDEVLYHLQRRQVVPLSKVKSLNDYKLLQLSWIYDLHFKSSYRLLLERAYIERITAHLPRTDEIRKLSESLKEFALSKGSRTPSSEQ
ncbi:MAG: HD domain-containing protein [Nitrospirae bacterium]|nr:HD domain-containing protein [Nitrospirota bacterium]